jgi:formate hydrogenlyase transcriptional activator
VKSETVRPREGRFHRRAHAEARALRVSRSRAVFFLDEIGDITFELQPKLLRALQEQELERLGSTRTTHIDVCLIAATHRNLQSMIRNDQFREDLFYRLNVFPIEIPPLRERREDISLLARYFVLRAFRQMQKRIRSVPKQAMDALVNADWPGNIRELEDFIERCVILTQGEELNVPRAELKRSATRSFAAGAATFEQAERQVIIDALKAASGKISGRGGAARTQKDDPTEQDAQAKRQP